VADPPSRARGNTSWAGRRSSSGGRRPARATGACAAGSKPNGRARRGRGERRSGSPLNQAAWRVRLPAAKHFWAFSAPFIHQAKNPVRRSGAAARGSRPGPVGAQLIPTAKLPQSRVRSLLAAIGAMESRPGRSPGDCGSRPGGPIARAAGQAAVRRGFCPAPSDASGARGRASKPADVLFNRLDGLITAPGGPSGHAALNGSAAGQQCSPVWAGAKGGKGLLPGPVHPLAQFGVDWRNCLPAAWRRASGGSPRETPSPVATWAATHPGGLTARQLRLGDRGIEGRDHPRVNPAGARPSRNWAPGLLLGFLLPGPSKRWAPG